jgi:hypothetical protein
LQRRSCCNPPHCRPAWQGTWWIDRWYHSISKSFYIIYNVCVYIYIIHVYISYVYYIYIYIFISIM